MKALVIGSTGLIGSHVVRALLAAGHEVRAMRRPSSRPEALAGVDGTIETVLGDVRERASITAAAKGCQWVFHAAGYYPTVSIDLAPVLERAVTTMRNVLDGCMDAGVGLLVYTSSLTTVGRSAEPGRLANENDFYVPGSVGDAYFEAKWAMESECWRYVDRELPVVVVNPTISIGPNDPKPTSGRIIRDIARGRLKAIVDGPVNAIDVRDVAVGHVRAAELGLVGERYILGNENTTMAELCARTARLAGVSPPLVRIPAPIAHAAAMSTELFAKYLTRRPPILPIEGVSIVRHGQHLDVSRARRELDLPQTPVDVAIQDALAWFRARGAI